MQFVSPWKTRVRQAWVTKEESLARKKALRTKNRRTYADETQISSIQSTPSSVSVDTNSCSLALSLVPPSPDQSKPTAIHNTKTPGGFLPCDPEPL